MAGHSENADTAVWAAIRKEERRDRVLRNVGLIAWTATFAALLTYAWMVAAQVSQLRRLVDLGMAQPQAVFQATIPLIAATGTVTLLIAVLSTIGMFLRMRTATLKDLQLRLASLEAILTARPDES
jgi:Na+/proline symporter